MDNVVVELLNEASRIKEISLYHILALKMSVSKIPCRKDRRSSSMVLLLLNLEDNLLIID